MANLGALLAAQRDPLERSLLPGKSIASDLPFLRRFRVMFLGLVNVPRGKGTDVANLALERLLIRQRSGIPSTLTITTYGVYWVYHTQNKSRRYSIQRVLYCTTHMGGYFSLIVRDTQYKFTCYSFLCENQAAAEAVNSTTGEAFRHAFTLNHGPASSAFAERTAEFESSSSPSLLHGPPGSPSAAMAALETGFGCWGWEGDPAPVTHESLLGIDTTTLHFSSVPGFGLARLAASAPTLAARPTRTANPSRRPSRAPSDTARMPDPADRSRASSGRSDAQGSGGDASERLHWAAGSGNGSGNGAGPAGGLRVPRLRHDSATTASSFAEENISEVDVDAGSRPDLTFASARTAVPANPAASAPAAVAPAPALAFSSASSTSGRLPGQSASTQPVCRRESELVLDMLSGARDQRETESTVRIQTTDTSEGMLLAGRRAGAQMATWFDAHEEMLSGQGSPPSGSMAGTPRSVSMATGLQSEVASISDMSCAEDPPGPATIPPAAATQHHGASALLSVPSGPLPRGRSDLALPLVASVSMPPTPPRRMLALLTGLAADITLLSSVRPGAQGLCIYVQALRRVVSTVIRGQGTTHWLVGDNTGLALLALGSEHGVLNPETTYLFNGVNAISSGRLVLGPNGTATVASTSSAQNPSF
eukprot:m.72542 g.72542  ORF g.72542 m.72542 type:complete len:651 (+) comp12992_c0_seq3:1644-3596(+)